MDRKYNLKLDLQFKCNNSTMKFNQFDNNTSDFFMRITNGGKLVDIEKAIVVLATIKPSGKVASQFIEVENDIIYADLKSSMKDEIGTYTAQAMLILEDERVVTDPINYEVEEDKIFALLNDTVEATEDFTLLTDMLNRLSIIEISEEQRMINEAERILSEENRKIEEAKRVEAELIRQHEEADRAKYDATRESNENIRKQNESIRLANETNRIDEEAKRVEEENKRKLAEEERNANYNFMTEDEERRRSEANAHKEAEVLRVQAETNRVNEEAKRRTTEQARVSAENTRVSNENTREANEVVRKNNETQRVEAETQRQNRYNSFISDAEVNANNFENYTNNAKVKEEERKSNELDRKSQEDRRVSNENERVSSENTRKANEETREENETSRQNVFENKVDEFNEKIVELNTTKENFISSVNTKVDNKISELDNAKSDMTTTVSNKVNEVENRFNALTSSQQQDAEVIDARDGETSLKARLDRDIEKAKQVYVNIEGSHISTDSSSGYAKDVEILGNTVQSASNLADIRSVGEKVEGQELYEIPVLSCGKNLLDLDKVEKTMVFTGSSHCELVEYVKIKKNTNYCIKGHYEKNTTTIGHGGISVVCTKSIPKNKDTWYMTQEGCTSVLITESYSADVKETFNSGDNNYMAIYVGIATGTANNHIATLSNFQLEEGTVATPYEPYVEDKLTILSPVQLEKVGDVADRIICKDGVWGVEKNNIKVNAKDLTFVVYRDTNDVIIFNSTVSVKQKAHLNGISNKLKYSSSTWNDTIVEDSIGLDNSTLRIFVKFKKSTLSTIEDFNKFKEDLFLLYQREVCEFIPLPHSQQVKLRTFANKTNISFLTEIEGTIKAQVPKSIGATVNTHTEQISNLNKELDRVKKLEESTVSTVETECDFTTVEATSNGYFEDVKLEGKTLVNLVPNEFSINYTASNSYDGYKGLGQSFAKQSIANGGYVLQDLKPSTVYTLIFNVVSLGDNSSFYINNYDASVCAIQDRISITKTNIGLNILKVTTVDDVASKPVVLRCQNASMAGLVHIKDFVLLEGDHTQNPPSYFEGLKSVGQSATTSEDGADEIVVSTTSKYNYFDYSLISKGRYLDSSSISTLKYNGSICVEKGEVIDVNIDKSLTIAFYSFSDENGYTQISEFKSGCFTFSIPTDVSSIGYEIKKTGGGSIVVNYIKDKKISIISMQDKKRLLYYNNETQSWEKPILRQWDSIEKHSDGKYYYHQRSGEVVLNGSENWYLSDGVDSNGLYLGECRQYASLFKKGSHLICNTLKVRQDTVGDKVAVSTTNYGIMLTGEQSIRIKNSSCTSLDSFKQWLQANNVTVVYQLAQEKVYECTNIDLITYANETNYIVESGAISPRTTLKVHNNISNVVSLLQKKVSLLESSITSYMITQNRLMLASRYNADTVSFKVDVATLRNSFEYDNDLYELILNNILVGKDNYNREYIENLIIFYWMDFVISDEMYSTLFEIIEEQHNPKIIEEETPLI